MHSDLGVCLPLLSAGDPGLPIVRGPSKWFPGSWDLEWHSAAQHPDWTASYELLRPYPNQRQRVVDRQSAPPES
jgi:hypothetical protein